VTAVDAVAPDLGAAQACRALGISRATLYRRRRPPAPPAFSPPRPRPPRSRSVAERQTVGDVLHAPRFVDVAPAEVVATLLDEGSYLASERTMDPILADAGQTGERRNQLTHPRRVRPELLATRPNELWSWDIERHEAP
jgi:putative transposase